MLQRDQNKTVLWIYRVTLLSLDFCALQGDQDKTVLSTHFEKSHDFLDFEKFRINGLEISWETFSFLWSLFWKGLKLSENFLVLFKNESVGGRRIIHPVSQDFLLPELLETFVCFFTVSPLTCGLEQKCSAEFSH